MGDTVNRMRRLLSFLNLVFATIFLSIVALILYPFDRKGDKVNKIGRLWAIIHLKVCGIRVSLEGLENISEPPYIFMCNHQSVLDIFALLSSLRLSFKWIAKKELFFVPFLGWALKIGKNISLDRKNPRKALKAMSEAARKIKDGMNIIIFPEGTWSKDGTLLPFKKGGFSLALRTGAPIIPVGIKGTGKLQPEGCFVPREKGEIHIKIGKPVYMEEEGNAAKTRLMLEVRSRIERLIGCRDN
ncbi:MAG: lysophospholipid acyltransferase family protein [Proteobacteria bacterium]|jgi:1-acyl-sn-glycerol-3-phosphate acyltransferase|nr:lysophospholipid acyltransferase family protein [Pseudomonadota bacterium]